MRPVFGQFSDTSAAGTQLHKVPFTLKDNTIWVQARVNGYPVTLKIDTGATASVFAARLLTVHNSKEIEVRTAGGMVKASIGDARLEIGDLKFQLKATYLRDFIDQGVIGLDVARPVSAGHLRFQEPRD